jgi:2-polyprenyl-6-methoxyphenol hydroxylase-like FAD-dependent oxidoreductase
MRVLIVGSGLSGLVMGHCLLRAGIDDFVILERRPDRVEQSGSVLAVFPHTFRILDQLDLLHDVQKLAPPMRRWVHLDSHGRTISDGGFFDYLQTK